MGLLVGIVAASVAATIGLAAAIGRATPENRSLRADDVSIDDVPDAATARIAGTVRAADRTLRAPHDDGECVYFRSEVARSSDATWWSDDEVSSEAVEFIVEDDTGRALVSMEHARFDLGPPRERTTAYGERRFLRIRQVVVRPGDIVSVVGHCTWRWEMDPDPSSASGYRTSAQKKTVLVISGGAKTPVVVSASTAR